MQKIVRCSCGMQFQSEQEGKLMDLVRRHAQDAHALELSDDQIRDLMEIDQQGKERTMTKTLACGDIMEGCPATFTAASEDELLAVAGKHAAEVHGLEITPELVEVVRGHIRDSDES